MDAALSHGFSRQQPVEGSRFPAPILLKHFLPSLMVVYSVEEPLEVDRSDMVNCDPDQEETGATCGEREINQQKSFYFWSIHHAVELQFVSSRDVCVIH